MKKNGLILSILLACAFFCATADAAHYSLPVFPNGSVLRNPNGGVAAYFQVYPDTTVRGSAVLNLWYSYTPIVIPELSTMTISVNGTPIDSRILEVDGAARSNWQLEIGEENFQGGVNEIEVSVVHRTIDGLCRDVDNDANWFIIRPETRLSFALEKSADKLAHFPHPFVDYYTPEEMNTAVYLPDDFGSDTLSELLNLATALGRASQGGIVPNRLLVRTGKPGDLDVNEIVLGRTANWMPNAAVREDEAILSFDRLPNGRARLLIAANDDRGLAKGVAALGRPLLVRTFLSDIVRLASPLPAAATDGRSVPGSRRELFTLADYGYATDIGVSGAFHQEAQLFIPRPPNYRAAPGAYIDLHFRHSSVLDPKKSAVTVYINDIPIRAQTLREENANGGVLRAEIPASELGSAFWNVRFAFYHDLGIIDCSKRYDDVAWSVVDRKTTFFFKRGDLPYYPTWENFPNDFHVDAKGDVGLTLLLIDEPDDRTLTAIFRLAYYIGMNNAANIGWQVKRPDEFDAASAPGSIIAVGGSEKAAWSALETYLPIYRNGEGYRVEDWLEIAPDVLRDFDIYQVARVDDGKWIYAFMHRSAGRLQSLVDFSLRAPIPIGGQVSLVDDNGSVTSFQREAQMAKRRIPWFDYIASRIGGTAAIYALVLAAVILVTLLLMFFTMRKTRTG